MIGNRFKPVMWCCLVTGVLLIAACAHKPITRETALERLPRAGYPHFSDQRGYEQLARSIEMSLTYLRKLPSQRPVAFGSDVYTVAQMIRSLEVFLTIIAGAPDSEQLNQVIAERYRVYQAAGRAKTNRVLFTGYYEPVLQGSSRASAEFCIPIHSRPEDLVEIDLSAFAPDLKGRRIVGRYTNHTVVPYPERDLIRRQPDFDRIAPPIVWVRDEVDLFNLMVQGSGEVLLESGKTLQIQFDVSNGRPYRSIGRLLIDQGKIDANQMSMQAIREYLHQHPQEAQAILNHNPRYIFFRRVDQGPLGALGVALTAHRSMAIDRKLFPSAALAFVAVPAPVVTEQGEIQKWAALNAFVLAQDAGSAIQGAGRADLFWGHGLQAEVAAGHLKHEGQLYFLMLKPDAEAVH